MLKYYIKDLIKNILIPFESELELAYWWRRINGINYDDLNMNGHDTRIVKTVIYDPTVVWSWISRTETMLRRYMVIEVTTNRVIDIRDWHIERFPTPKYSYGHYYGSGRKNHSHRKGCASMMRRTLKEEHKLNDIDLLDIDEVNLIKQIQSKPSHFAKTNAWDYAEKAHWTDWSSSKCWKDQCKAPKQYWRHKKGFGPQPKIEDEYEEDFDPSFECETDVA